MSFWAPKSGRPGAGARSMRQSYECLRDLLNRNTLLLEQMAEIDSDLRFYPPHNPLVLGRIRRMAEDTLLLVEDLNLLTHGRFDALYAAYERIRSEVFATLRSLASDRRCLPSCLPLEAIAEGHRELVGGKAYHLARARRVVPDNVPPGFVITTEAYWRFLHNEDLFPSLLPALREVEVIEDKDLLLIRLQEIDDAIAKTRLPEDLGREILQQASRCEAPFGWAVRSSAVGEDGRFSFAGQFESLLHVPQERLCEAYRHVVRSRYRERAVAYRRALGLNEIDTPMAVLFLAMVEARSAGVLYTKDPAGTKRECMLVTSVWGLGQELVAGRVEADSYYLKRSAPDEVLEQSIAAKEYAVTGRPQGGLHKAALSPEQASRPSLDRNDLRNLWEVGHSLEGEFRGPLDIEWVIDPCGRLWVVQVRNLTASGGNAGLAVGRSVGEPPLLEGGCSVQAGRAVGPVVKVHNGAFPAAVPEGSLLVLDVATPDIAALLPNLAGCIAEVGNPAGHAATLLREWQVPTLFGLKGALRVLNDGETVGLDATLRQIYRGVPWPELAGQERPEGRGRLHSAHPNVAPLLDRISGLTLFDPSSPRFRPESTTSLHDIIRLVHEKAVEATFDLGDMQKGRPHSNVKRLTTDIPLNILVLDLGGGVDAVEGRTRSIEPDQILSVPFRSLWDGVSDTRVRWSGRRQVSLKGFSSVLVSSFAGSGAAGRRRLGAPNYLLVAEDYMNMNLRLAYHYAMIDSLVGESPENNFVIFRFRGGGARADRRAFRALFLSETLRRLQFCVDRRGDLVTAWYRRYPRPACEQALRMLGRLMACSRQLDMLIADEKTAHHYADRFIAEDYEAFL